MSGAEQSPSAETRRHLYYIAGFLVMGLLPMTNLLVPLWAVAIGASPFMIGIAVGARSVLPVLFAIHGGALMDRLGVRRVLIVSVFVALAMAPLYPLLPFVSALIAIQVIGGFAQSLGWIGAQTQMAQAAGGDRTAMGRFTFAATAGNSTAPMLAGLAWDLFGPWGGFGLMTAWSAAFAACVIATPPAVERKPEPRDGRRALRDMLPRLRDYADALAMWMVPVVATVMTASMLMAGAHSMRGSFYPVYLTDIGVSKTLIGILVTTGTVTSALAGLCVGRVTRFVPSVWLIILALVGATVAIGVTPLTASLPALFALAILFGLMAGMGFPLILSELARAADVSQQGISVGLRTTVNRLVAMSAPIGIGAMVEFADIATAFLIVTAITISVVCFLAIRLRKLRLNYRPK